MSKSYNIIIVGAGPAGLAVAGRLRKKGLDFRIIEKSNKIASSWHNHYDRLHLHTIKQYSHLPYLEFPDSYPLYVPRLKLIEYYETYAEKFDIKPDFNLELRRASKVGDIWKLELSNGEFLETNNLVVTSGANHYPKEIKLKGQESFTGKIIHSRKYKNANPFKSEKVLVLGMGNTGAEIALDLAENNVEVGISVRSPICVVPRDVFGRPVQVTGKMLDKIPFGIGDWIGTQVRKMVIGDLTKYGIPMSKKHPAVQLRELGKTPMIDLGTIDMIKKGKINVFSDIDEIIANKVRFKDGVESEFDSIILATGYKPGLRSIFDNVEIELDKFNFPKSPIAQNDLNKGLYFVGFDNYKLGGILGTIFNDSKIVVEALIKSKTK